MSDTGKQSPLGVNFEGSSLANVGLTINTVASSYIGESKFNGVPGTQGTPNVGGSGYKFGSIVQDTVLRLHTWAINDAYGRNKVTRTSRTDVYDNLINVGSTTIPALGNSMPPTYVPQDAAKLWARETPNSPVASAAEKFAYQKDDQYDLLITEPVLPAPATTGYAITHNGSDSVEYAGQGQEAAWYPYTGYDGDGITYTSNATAGNPNSSITQWGYTRLHALQAWNEFNWNGEQVDWESPEYKEFLSSFLSAQSFIAYSNQAIFAMHNSKTFLEGAFSNMNDLISADIAGVNLSSWTWGNDLINLGTSIDLADIDTFGMPSSLLKTLAKYGALTEELVLALLASGIQGKDITAIVSGELIPTVKQEQQIYGSFLVITGLDLINVLALLKCKTQNIQTLADLLSVKKIFPNSYQSLTIPQYNSAPGPTNSKTYYLIYENGGVNSSLELFDAGSVFRTPVTDAIEPVEDATNFTEPSTTLGSHLFNVIPKADAIAAAAFAYSMLQIRNIKQCDFEKFAQVVRSNETIESLTLTAGTDKPTDQALVTQGLTPTALGSGVYGTYTLSDLFGSMSGLPYPWKLTYQRISELQTTKLHNIYQQNFLAITWKGATATLTLEYDYVLVTPEDPPTPATYQRRYRIASVSLTQPGGGYGRGSAPAPQVIFSYGGFGNDGATAATAIGTDDRLAASNGGGTFGRVTTLALTQGSFTNYGSVVSGIPTLPGAGAPVANTDVTIRIQTPPEQALPVQTNGLVATNGVNTNYTDFENAVWLGGTNGMNTTVIPAYITQANQEIISIRANNITTSNLLNSYWNLLGSQLMREQRSRYLAFAPVTIIAPDDQPLRPSNSIIRKDYFVNSYPTIQYAFVDALPELAQDTKPHMSAQTLEAIADLSTTGGQSLIAKMREERNNRRLMDLGTFQDNNIPDKLYTLTFDAPEGFIPAYPGNTLNGQIITPVPLTTQEVQPNELVPYIITVPIEINPAIPPEIDAAYTSSTLLPSSPTVSNAIDQVIECNCDCWID
jgi:hypothetical protein